MIQASAKKYANVTAVTRAFLLPALLGVMALAGCASSPNPALLEAEAAVQEVSNDESVVRDAPLRVAEAQEILGRAQRAQDAEEKTHRARLALLKAKTARANARQINAEKQALDMTRQAEDLALDARARAAENALREAQITQRLAAEELRRAEAAQRRARELRAQADRERSQQTSEDESQGSAQVTFDQTLSPQQRLREVQQSLAELSPHLSARGLIFTLGEVLFDFESTTLKPYTQRIMDRLANFLQQNSAYGVAVQGHTDSVGDGGTNLEFSRARAQSVSQALISRGVATRRVSTQGFGERQPIASNDTAAGRRENRRVEVILSPGS